ncbi:hypothetical protein C8F01DRAFT_1209156 [Mycena amicta]|nr:hypothetical protein C8F01DRAFT_1209156 [Mycena amicta]
MPALAMEGPSEVEPAAGESDSENEDDIGEDDADDGDDDDDDSRRPSVDVRDETESPFVPLRLDTTSSLSLEFGGLLSGVGLGLGSPVISKGKGKERESVQIPFAIQPQASQSSSKTILPGKTPMPQSPQPRNSDYFSIRSPSADGRTPIPGPASPLVRTIPMPPLPSPGGERPGMYKHASRSMVDIFASVTSPEEDTLSTKGKGKEDERGEAPAYEGHGVQRNSTLKRRRSMPEVSAAPPPYTSPMFPSPFFEAGTANLHPLAQVRIVPREDEGRETLPPYSNSILLRSIMPRKMEFSAPGVQAKDRKWRRVLCELEGTVFRVYRCAAEGWWERRVGVGDVTAAGVGSAAVAAAAAIKARAAAREGAEDIKLAGEQGRLESNGEGSGGESGEGTTEITMAPGSSMSSSRSRASSSATSASHTLPSSASSITDGNSISTSASRSRLNLGLSLLKPRSHGRSKSELPNAPKTPVTPRSSLSVQRPSFGSNSSPPASAMPSTSGAALTPSRSNVSLASSSRTGLLSARTPATPSSAKGKQKGTTSADLSEPDQQDLIRAYTLQHAESGLGNDYLKRKHVLRFLLQARDVGDVVDWIEALHCATNIALDLDERPMPKGPLFPRRRRRRPRATAGGPADRPDGSSTAT